jgi:hypothetical protein
MFDLDVDAPNKVPGVLRAAAQAYWEAQAELPIVWQDEGAGRVWGRYAHILKQAAERCESAMKKEEL